jgi:hypothetical protein
MVVTLWRFSSHALMVNFLTQKAKSGVSEDEDGGSEQSARKPTQKEVQTRRNMSLIPAFSAIGRT